MGSGYGRSLLYFTNVWKTFSRIFKKIGKKSNSRLNTTKLVNFLGFDTINTPKPYFAIDGQA